MENKTYSLTVVIPAYNEAESLVTTIPSALQYCKDWDWKLIIVNDGSSDNSSKIIDQYKSHPELQVVHHKLNRGYGAALKTGFMEVDTEYAVSFDADGQHRFSDINHLFELLISKDADMIVGSRASSKHKQWFRELGKWIIRRIAALMMPMPLSDLNSGFKLYRTSLLQQYIHLCPDSMAFSDIITLIFLYQRHKVIEAPIVILPRSSGTSSINPRTAFETTLEILNIVMMFAPLRFFLPVSIICFIFGVAWSIPFIFWGRGVSVGSLLAILTALILFTLGLVSEQISQLRKEQLRKS